MRVLFVYPEYPDTFWSFKYVLKFIAKKAAFPPLGLLTIAAMLPDTWDKKLVDLNVEPLTGEHLAWADIVFLGAMIVQKKSAQMGQLEPAPPPLRGAGESPSLMAKHLAFHQVFWDRGRVDAYHQGSLGRPAPPQPSPEVHRRQHGPVRGPIVAGRGGGGRDR